MKFTDAELADLHKQSLNNQERILQAKNCCCFGCLACYPSSEVVSWLINKDEKTALCPQCKTDSVLAINEFKPISKEILKAMEARYFGVIGKYTGKLKGEFNTFTEMFNASQKPKS